MNFHPYNLGENICLRHSKSILSLLTSEIQLSHDNYLQISESGYPVISGGKKGRQFSSVDKI